MKKFFAAGLCVFALQGLYILKLRNDLSLRKEINTQQVLKIFSDTGFAYTQVHDVQQNQGLSEPQGFDQSTDILERINMLEQHLVYNPSIDWIKSVYDHAKREIAYLRNHQSVILFDDPHAVECTRHKTKN